jgi:hypothetical protein
MLQYSGGPPRPARAAGAAPGQPDPWHLPLHCVQRAASSACGTVPPSAWWLQFGPDHVALARAIGALQLQAVQPQQLACVQLWHQGQVVYQLDSRADVRGSPLPAGDLLHAMARMQGHADLVIDADGLGLVPATTALRLLLTGDSDACPPQARVVLLPPR